MDYEILPVSQSQTHSLTEIEKSRAMQEVQASLIIAKRFPRDINQVFTRIMESCKRPSLAASAMYKYPRGGEMVTGPSIRLAEVMAQNYGNLDFGVREIERKQGVSIAESYCWDMETNVKQTKIFEVPHEIHTKKGKKTLVDPRDIYELVANNGARRLRACILGIIPADITEAAVSQCKMALSKGNGEPIADRIRKMLMAFKDLGVSQEMIEKRLSHPMDLTTPDEIVELTSIYTSIRDKVAKRSDFFDFIEDDVQDSKAEELKNRINAQAKHTQKSKTETVSFPPDVPFTTADPEFEKAVAQMEDSRNVK